MKNADTIVPGALRRRTLVTGGAWAAPVIALAVAAPAAAASTPTRVTGTIAFLPDTYHGTRNGDQVDFPPLTGILTVSSGPLPLKVALRFSAPEIGRIDLRSGTGLFAMVDPATGRFAFAAVANTVVGGHNPFGFAYVRVEEGDAGEVVFGESVAQLIG